MNEETPKPKKRGRPKKIATPPPATVEPVAEKPTPPPAKPAAGKIPPCPPSDPRSGDKTPEVVAWWFKHHPKEAAEKYRNRKFTMPEN